MKTFTAAAIASSALLSLASAQEQYTIDPNSVSAANRQYWCSSQITQCPLICLQPPSETATTRENTCDSDSLTFSCVCGDGLTPNVTQYTQTVPFFICQEWGNQCVKNCGQGDNACASDCRENHPCGAQDPIRPNSSTITSTMSSTASASRTASDAGATTDSSGGTIYSGFGAASSTGGSSSQESSASSPAADSGAGRASALEVGQTFGFLALAGAFFGGFAMIL